MNKNHETPNKSRKKAAILIGVACIIVVLLCGMGAPFLFMSAKGDTIVRIPRDANDKQLSDTLSKYFDKSYSDKVMTIFHSLGADAATRHGAYNIEDGMSPLKAGRLLARGPQTPVKITINGFRSLDLMCERIAKKMNFKPEELKNTITDSVTLANYGLKPSQAMALFLDDTYLLYWDSTPNALVHKIGKHYQEVWNDERKRKADALGISPAEAVIIASIADEETLKADEKGIITRLYLNRLQKGMKLQADPTVRFALNDFTIRRVTTPMLSVNSPYNTYKYAGLPPGPIRTTSVSTIDALLDSKPHPYMYMCAKEDFSGYHNFSESYEEHMQNARRYQQKLNEIGIKGTSDKTPQTENKNDTDSDIPQ
ncbi:MAG: endolytic transglycosylase MltG [Prevotella sp.]|nr:endolytic transglycosylase MltG [Bacteroides sp.]MCM1366966.1 endolytic transglycosylase MltG [Prevotella sp.]MCM1436750.1 endolytic transglycosylase MltG [Prevotella sp.]